MPVGVTVAVLAFWLMGTAALNVRGAEDRGPDSGGAGAARDEAQPAAEAPSDAAGQGRVPPEVQVCLGCHTIDRNRRKGADAAPPLWGILGRTPRPEGVGAPDWTREALDRWLQNPRAMAPGTESRFPGYADPERREAVLRFLDGQG